MERKRWHTYRNYLQWCGHGMGKPQMMTWYSRAGNLSAFLDLKGKEKGESVTTGHLIGSVTLGGMLQLAKRHAEEDREWLDVNLDTPSSLSLSCHGSQLANSNTNPKGSQPMQPL